MRDIFILTYTRPGHIFSSLGDRKLLNVIESNIIQTLTWNCQIVANVAANEHF